MKPRTGRTVLIAVGLIALVAGGGYWALKPYDEAILAPPPPPPPPVVDATPKPPEQVSIDVQSMPAGARVSRTDTGEQLGVTPFEAKLDKKDGATVTLKLELDGRQSVERPLSLSRSAALSVDLPAAMPAVEKVEQPKTKGASIKKKTPAATSRDGVVDPFDK
jgi:serine/threonine-protein kinase